MLLHGDERGLLPTQAILLATGTYKSKGASQLQKNDPNGQRGTSKGIELDRRGRYSHDLGRGYGRHNNINKG